MVAAAHRAKRGTSKVVPTFSYTTLGQPIDIVRTEPPPVLLDHANPPWKGNVIQFGNYTGRNKLRNKV